MPHSVRPGHGLLHLRMKSELRQNWTAAISLVTCMAYNGAFDFNLGQLLRQSHGIDLVLACIGMVEGRPPWSWVQRHTTPVVGMRESRWNIVFADHPRDKGHAPAALAQKKKMMAIFRNVSWCSAFDIINAKSKAFYSVVYC